MNNLYWNVYRNLERELLAIADVIHVDDKQINTYSMKIADLLVRTATEVESISKELYRLNGGPESATGRHLYFDSDCINFLNQKWNICKKKVFLVSPYFYLEDMENTEYTPLLDADKKKINRWLNAYQAVKHDRANCLELGSIKNLLRAMAGLCILNVYYRDEARALPKGNFADFDSSLGSQLFSIKIHPFPGIGLDDVYRKNDDFDECVYLCQVSGESKQPFFEITKKINAKISEIIVSCIEKEIQEKGLDFNAINESERHSMVKKYEVAASKQAHQENFREYRIAIDSMHYQCVLNKNQY